jgi:hypothetical protein
VAVVRPTCRGFHHSFRDGDPAEDQVTEMLALSRVVPRRRFAPAVVSVLDGAEVPVEVWMDAEEAILEDIDGLAFSAAITHIREVLHRLADREPLQIRPLQRQAALEAIISALSAIMRHVLAQPEGPDPERIAFGEESLRRLDIVAASLGDPAPPLADDAQQWVNLLLRSSLLSKRFAAHGGVCEGVGEFILAVEVSRRLAEPDPGGEITAAALSEPLAHWRRFVAIKLIAMILLKARPAILDLVLHP